MRAQSASQPGRGKRKTPDARAHHHESLLAFERALWRRGCRLIAGLDEVGAGPWAGPVMAACVVLDPARTDPLVGVDDSKKLSPERREVLASQIRAHCLAAAVCEASVEEIDTINIYQAALLAMRRALEKVLQVLPDVGHLLIDARRLAEVRIAQTPLVGGDGCSLSIAAASILAKVDRDALMRRASEHYPNYGFERHKGYGTPEHRAAIAKYGVTPFHRYSFAPVREAVRAGAP